ncbi:hypothetical protein [Microbacterium sp. SLBN-111]|uniref:hypothetical protein n=1 Tax=Microbacterium sp. SLBN-111 TaxID=3377733 RepID=UPI003C712752
MDSDVEMTRALRRSIRELLAEPDGDLEISSLLRAIADSPDLWDVAQQELAPRTGHLDLHIEGAGTDQHRTVAKSFGTFVSAMADAVKYTMREISNISRSPDELLIEPGPGSVRAVFIAPTRVHSGAIEIRETLDEVLPEEDSYSESLRRTAVVLANAAIAGVDSEAVDGALAAIPAPARPELRRALSEVVSEGWALSGSFSQRGLPTMPLSLSPGSAKYLRDRLEEAVTQTEQWETTGVLDGHTWSSNTMRFIPSDRSIPITASFDSARVQLEVARLDAEPGKRVRALFRVLVTKSQARPSGRRSYALIDIEEIAGEPVAMELDGI